MIENKATVAFADNFLNSFAVLPRQIQKKVTEFINKFRNNPKSLGIHLEKLDNTQDEKIFSARIDDTYRAILAIEKETNVYLILWVDHHDEAYEWARRKKCLINKALGTIQIFDVLTEEKIGDNNKDYLFAKYSVKELNEIGVPTEQISLVKNIENMNSFISQKDSFAKDTYEYLEWLANGFEYDEVKELYNSQKLIGEPIPSNLAEALQTDNTKQSFVVVEGEEELERIMAEPLEKWRIFLHPSQRKIVEKNYNGPARVTGGAGTGKTVVAIHRAKFLAKQLEPDKNILFTTFTSNLANDIQDNLRKICDVSDLKKIEVVNLDSWVSQFLKLNGYNYSISYDDNKIKDAWERALNESGEDIEYDSTYIKDEYEKVIVCQDELTLQAYMSATRIGRGTRLDRKTKLKIWHVVEEYLRILQDEQIKDIDTAMYECRKVLSNYKKNLSYQNIIVDEGQDFSTNAYKLLRLIAGDEHKNDMFIVGDAHQRIYNKKAILSKCGINVRGRSNLLKINYRTTEETRKFAFALLKNIPFDNLDNEIENQDKCQSLTHGDNPIIKEFREGTEENEYLFEEINKLISQGVDARNICIIARTHKHLTQYNSYLTSKGMRVFEIRGSKIDDRNYDGIRLATMHRVKGLEFQYIFIVACNDRVIPLASAINNIDAITKEDNIISERCLLYVALTRAQKQAYITSYGRKSEFLK